jgi:hypothetical protein
LDLSDTVKDGARLVFVDPGLRRQLLMAFTEDSRLHVREVADLYRLVQSELQPTQMVQSLVRGEVGTQVLWLTRVLVCTVFSDDVQVFCCCDMKEECFLGLAPGSSLKCGWLVCVFARAILLVQGDRPCWCKGKKCLLVSLLWKAAVLKGAAAHA